MATIPNVNDLLLTVVDQANKIRLFEELVQEQDARIRELEAAENRQVAAQVTQGDPQRPATARKRSSGGKQ